MAGPDLVLGRFFVGRLLSVLGRDLGFVVAASPGVVLVLGDGFSVDRLFAGISELKRDFEFGVASAGAIAVLGGCHLWAGCYCKAAASMGVCCWS